MPFKKGKSGNPNGRPKKDKSAPLAPEKLFKTALLMELKEKGADMPELREIARKAINQAKDGDNSARTCVLERIDGKVPQPLGTPDGEGNVVVVMDVISRQGKPKKRAA